MKKIVMSLVSVAVFALAACAPATNTANPLVNVAGAGNGALAGGSGVKLTKAQYLKWIDCVGAKAGAEGKASIDQIRAIWAMLPEEQFAQVGVAQFDAMNKAYAQLGCAL